MENRSRKKKEVKDPKDRTPIKQKQSQKKRQRRSRRKGKQTAVQIPKEPEIEQKKLETIRKIDERIKAKKEERLEFIASLGNNYKENEKTINHAKRIDAEIADKKRQESYLKVLQLQPKIESDQYRSSDKRNDRTHDKGMWR